MRALSASNALSDPYRAGAALGDVLRAINPEVVFLFSSAGYGGTAEVLEGLYDAVGRDDLVVVGNSGDGFYEGAQAAELGVAALGLDSGGAVRWFVAKAEGVGQDPEGTARAGLRALDAAMDGERPAFVYLVSDFRTDASGLERVLREVDVPIVGGLAGTGVEMAGCVLYANREVFDDGVVLLGAVGPVRFDVVIGQSVAPVGEPGRIDQAAGTTLQSINQVSASDFVERTIGKPALMTDRGVLSLAVFEPEHPNRKRLLSIVPDIVPGHGALALFGGVAPGNMVQVTMTDQDRLVAEVLAVAGRSRQLGFEPVAGLLVSCAWRKNVLRERAAIEAEALIDATSGRLMLAGFSSLGEFGPFKEDGHFTANLFHNMTAVLLLIGDSP